MPAGRPSLYTPELGNAICARIAEGETLVSVCKDDDMPGVATVLRWPDPEFRELYTRAKEIRLEVMAEDIIAISDDGANDTYIDEETKQRRTDHDVINRSRLRVDTRKWLLARLASKTYGDRVTQQHTGPDGGPVSAKLIIEVVKSPGADPPTS